MDARVDGVPVTPRAGKAVDVNALWINGLGAAAAVLARARRDTAAVDKLRAAALASFRFGPLDDVLDGPPALRPNQVLAYSLPHGPRAGQPLPPMIGSALLTPLGLRSLAPDDPEYRGTHRGGPVDRDRAYHQGTVWPWLIGQYAQATGDRTALAGLEAHLAEWGLGSVSETAEGDAPHRATGCPFQAWSVAETLRTRPFTLRI
jgi:predicted glycogen debranching enzyme